MPWRNAVLAGHAIGSGRLRVREFYDRRASQEWLDALAPLGTDWRKRGIRHAHGRPRHSPGHLAGYRDRFVLLGAAVRFLGRSRRHPRQQQCGRGAKFTITIKSTDKGLEIDSDCGTMTKT
jgi:hypothetical protein